LWINYVSDDSPAGGRIAGLTVTRQGGWGGESKIPRETQTGTSCELLVPRATSDVTMGIISKEGTNRNASTDKVGDENRKNRSNISKEKRRPNERWVFVEKGEIRVRRNRNLDSE